MKEVILRDFFLDNIPAEALRPDLDGALRFSGGRTFLEVDRMEEEFPVRASHLVKICDAFLEGKLAPEHIEAVGFCIMASDAFDYDTATDEAELISETCSDWAAPEINYSLTRGNMLKFRERLLTGRDTFSSADIAK